MVDDVVQDMMRRYLWARILKFPPNFWYQSIYYRLGPRLPSGLQPSRKTVQFPSCIAQHVIEFRFCQICEETFGFPCFDLEPNKPENDSVRDAVRIQTLRLQCRFVDPPMRNRRISICLSDILTKFGDQCFPVGTAMSIRSRTVLFDL